MSESYYEGRVRHYTRALERDRDKQAKEETKAAKAEREAGKYRAEGDKATADTSRSSKLRRAESKGKEASKAREAAAKASRGVSDSQTGLNKAQRQLSDARATRERRDREKAARERKRAERDRERADDQRDRAVSSLDSRASALEEQLREAQRKLAPPQITVLFLASSPEDLEPLRLDKESREIQQRLRATDYRESVRFEWRMARQLTDLIQDLNETRPDVVHFSGHGNQKELAFEDADGATAPLGNDLLGRVLRSNSTRIRLAVFNSCQSAAQAELACESVDLAIGMGTSIADEDAKTFAAQFYNSLGFGHSVKHAFEQASLQVALSDGDDKAPQLFAAEGIDPATVVLVNPDAESDSLSEGAA